jgi:hypothetical protein
MAQQLARAVRLFIIACPYVVAVHDLVTKIRIELQRGYFVDLYYNETLGKYAYTLIAQDRRVIGWDNARHHPGLANFPHHFHCEDGRVEPSTLTGEPEHDIMVVVAAVNAILRR